jgi:hypothetical protein
MEQKLVQRCETEIVADACNASYSSNLVIPALFNTGKSYVDVKLSISNGLVLPSGGAALTWGRCMNNRATLHSLIWDLAKLGVVLQIALQINTFPIYLYAYIPIYLSFKKTFKIQF